MTGIGTLPGRLSALVSAITAARGPVQVITTSEAPFELLLRVCREQGVPLSPVTPRTRTRAESDVAGGATSGYLTTNPAPLPHATLTLHVANLTPGRPQPVRDAQIRATADEMWRRGRDLTPQAVWPSGSRIPAQTRLQPGKALAHCDDLGLGEDVATCVTGPDGKFPAVLRPYCGTLMREWGNIHGRMAITSVVNAPTPSHPTLSDHLSRGIAILLGVPYAGSLTGATQSRVSEEPGDRVRRLARELRLDPTHVNVGNVAGRHVLVVAPQWRSGWSVTVAGHLLLSAGALSVRPFTLSTGIPQEHPQ